MDFLDDDDDEEEFALVRSVQCGIRSIRTTVTASAAEVSRWIQEQLELFRPASSPERINAEIMVGMAVQAGRRNPQAAATLQLSIDRNCLIFQISVAEGCPENLRRFMVDPNIMFVGVWNREDPARLWASRHRLVANNPMDLRYLSELERGQGRFMTTAELAEFVLQQRGALDDQLAAAGNWEAAQLGRYQVQYACHRAYLAYFIARTLSFPILYRLGYIVGRLGRGPPPPTPPSTPPPTHPPRR